MRNLIFILTLLISINSIAQTYQTNTKNTRFKYDAAGTGTGSPGGIVRIDNNLIIGNINTPTERLDIDANSDSLRIRNLAGTGDLLGIDGNGRIFKVPSTPNLWASGIESYVTSLDGTYNYDSTHAVVLRILASQSGDAGYSVMAVDTESVLMGLYRNTLDYQQIIMHPSDLILYSYDDDEGHSEMVFQGNEANWNALQGSLLITTNHNGNQYFIEQRYDGNDPSISGYIKAPTARWTNWNEEITISGIEKSYYAIDTMSNFIAGQNISTSSLEHSYFSQEPFGDNATSLLLTPTQLTNSATNGIGYSNVALNSAGYIANVSANDGTNTTELAINGSAMYASLGTTNGSSYSFVTVDATAGASMATNTVIAGSNRGIEVRNTGITLYTKSSINYIEYDTLGNIRTYGLHNNTAGLGTLDEPEIRSGTFTPTLSNAMNIDGTPTASLAQWQRVGNVVTVTGQLTIDPTATSITELQMTLPIPSNMNQDYDAAGTIGCGTINQSGIVRAQASDDRAKVEFVAGSTSNLTFYYTYTYLIK